MQKTNAGLKGEEGGRDVEFKERCGVEAGYS